MSHVETRPGYDAMADLKPLAFDVVNLVNFLVVAALWLAGAWHEAPSLWLWHALILVPKILAIHFGTALAFQAIAKRGGTLIQTHKQAPKEFVLDEVLQTLIGFGLVVAPLHAWASTNLSLGRPTAYNSDLTACVPPFAASWQPWQQMIVYGCSLLFGAILADAYNYWKHRLFHTALLWPWHKYHHSHRNPSALAGYAISPVFGLATFWPIALGAIPSVNYYTPMYLGFVGFYAMLNHYLHCGYVLPWLEAPLAPLGIMTSAWHNTHHSRGRRGFYQTDQTFGEMTVWWDVWMGTHPGAGARPPSKKI